MESQKKKEIRKAAAKERREKREALQALKKKQRMSDKVREVRRASRILQLYVKSGDAFEKEELSRALEIIEGVVKKYDATSTTSTDVLDEILPPIPKAEAPNNEDVVSEPEVIEAEDQPKN